MTAPSFSNSPGSKVASQARGWSFQSRAPLFSPNGHPPPRRDAKGASPSSVWNTGRPYLGDLQTKSLSNRIAAGAKSITQALVSVGAGALGRGPKDGCRPRPARLSPSSRCSVSEPERLASPSVVQALVSGVARTLRVSLRLPTCSALPAALLARRNRQPSRSASGYRARPPARRRDDPVLADPLRYAQSHSLRRADPLSHRPGTQPGHLYSLVKLNLSPIASMREGRRRARAPCPPCAPPNRSPSFIRRRSQHHSTRRKASPACRAQKPAC